MGSRKAVSKQKEEKVVLSTCHYDKCKGSFLDDLFKPYCSATCRVFDVTTKDKKSKRKTKYKPEWCTSMLYKYLKYCEDSHLPRMRRVADATVPVTTIRLPSQQGYALYLGQSIEVFPGYARKYPDFNRALKIIKQVQYEYLTSFGVSGAYNSKTAGLILMSDHDMTERKQNDHTHTLGVVRSVYETADKLGQEEVTIIEHED